MRLRFLYMSPSGLAACADRTEVHDDQRETIEWGKYTFLATNIQISQ